MTIKRDILGTVVNIELTEQEIKEIHCAYLMNELNNKSPITKPAEIMPRNLEPEMKWDYMDKLRECGEALRKVYKFDTKARARILDQYDEYLYQAKAAGMTYRQINAMIDVSDYVLHNRVNRVRYIKTHAA